MKNVFSRAKDWWLYWGSQDERVRAGADKAGHVAFQVALLEAVGLYVYVSGGGPLHGPSLRYVLAGLLLLPILVYYIMWVRLGITYLDTPRQRKALWTLVAVYPLFLGALVWALLAQDPGTATLIPWLVPSLTLGSGVFIAGLTWGIHFAAKRRVQEMTGESEND